MRYINTKPITSPEPYQVDSSAAQLVRILNDPASSFWLKDLMRSGNARDAAKVVHDLEIAYVYFREKCDAPVVGASPESIEAKRD